MSVATSTSNLLRLILEVSVCHSGRNARNVDESLTHWQVNTKCVTPASQ